MNDKQLGRHLATFRRMLCVAAGAAIIWGSGVAQVHAGAKFPQHWRKTMTNDPAKNMYLRKFSEPLGNPDADTLRNVTLSIVIRDACEGDLGFNQAAGDEYLAKSGFLKLRGKAWDNASFLSASEFNGLDYRAVAHLCAGVDYLFGKQGVLIKDLFSPGTGEPKRAYDSANPYYRVGPLKKPTG
ncbi:MAG: hypothetical protein ACK43M_11485 [Allorhizobium sp.]